ncbi:universal stress protein [Brevundimonas bacteroides]|uniref:universal stress protein n=1 Tax=Brevundimonas bacteroides TaxID=74311 RepID=UPI00069179D9|nr:universal stress protein [Brevundimonas bacteroides]
MTYAQIAIAVDADDAVQTRLEICRDIALATRAAVIGIAAASPPPPAFGVEFSGGSSADLLVAYREATEVDLMQAHSAFALHLTGPDIISRWISAHGDPTAFCIRQARFADLVVLGCRNSRAPYQAPDPAEVLIASGRPVLMVPPTVPRSPVGEHALIAWRDGKEARRAVSAALPLLRLSRGVTIAAICSGDEDRQSLDEELAELPEYLARHGVAAGVVQDRLMHDTVGLHLLQEAASRGCGLIVAGGYGHPRLQEWMLGGVTRDLMRESSVCLLLSH